MPDTSSLSEPERGDEIWAILDGALEKLEIVWQVSPEPDLAQFLPPPGDPHRTWVLTRLVQADRECRERAGRPKPLAEYLEEWPELRALPHLADELNIPASEAKLAPSVLPPGALRIRCPHCRNPVAVVADEQLVDILCPSCGSHFSLTSVRPTTPHFPGGSKTIGKFTLMEEVGVGQFGSVWKAHDGTLDRWVAVKIPRRGQLDAAETELFLREARAAAQIRHPNIVSVHEVGREGDTVYIVSDYVEGATLGEWLTAERLTAREAAELCAKIAGALHEAHQAGVVHRDLKPGNILLDSAREPHITDFGLAKRESGEITMTLDGQTLGTPAYMPPEQARGKGHEADRRSDVYSLGVILFELLTGELPFRGETRMLIVQILTEEAPSPRKLNHHVPRDLETICLKCLEKDPNRRYQTARDLGDDLHRFLRGEAIIARPIGKAARLWRWCRRKPALASLSVAVGLLILTLAVGGPLVALQQSALRSEADNARQNAEISRDDARQASRRAYRHYYVAQMRLVQRDWETGDLVAVRERLEKTEPEHTGREDLRGFEWHYWYRKGHPELLTLEHPLAWRVVFTSDGQRVVSRGKDGSVKVWDAWTGRELTTFKDASAPEPATPVGAGGRVVTVVRPLAVGHAYCIVRDTLTGKATVVRDEETPTSSVAISPDGERVVVGGTDGTVGVWDAGSGQRVFSMKKHDAAVVCFAFSPDGKNIASGVGETRQGAPTVKIWNASTGEDVCSFTESAISAASLRFSPDGGSVATCSSNRLSFWDAATGKEIKTLAIRSEAPSGWFDAGFSPDWQRMAVHGEGGSIALLDVITGRKVASVSGHAAMVWSIAFGPDGARVASASEDGTVKVWDGCLGQQVVTFRHRAPVISSLAFSPDGRLVTAADQTKTVKTWDTLTGQEVGQFHAGDRFASCREISPDGRLLAADGVDGTVKVLDRSAGEKEITLGKVEDLARLTFSPDGRRIASAHREAIALTDKAPNADLVRLWDSSAGESLVLCKCPWGDVQNLAFSADGQRVALASAAGYVQVWDALTCRERIAIKGRPAIAGWLADDRRFVWYTRPFQQITVPVPVDETGGQTLQPMSFLCASFSSDGGRIVAGVEDGSLSVFDASSGEELLTCKGRSVPVIQVAFSPDGRRILSLGKDGAVTLWDASTGAELLVHRCQTANVRHVRFTPDGRRIALAANDAIELLDGRENTPELRAEREAIALVRYLFERPMLKRDVLDRIRAESRISPEVRRVAIQLAESFRDDPRPFHEAAWLVARRPDGTADDYARALEHAQTAALLAPDDVWVLRSLGVAQYRTGKNEEAVETLARCIAAGEKPPSEAQPAELAFLAMAHKKLNHVDEAKRLVDRLRRLLADDRFKGDTEAVAFLREAEGDSTVTSEGKPASQPPVPRPPPRLP